MITCRRLSGLSRSDSLNRSGLIIILFLFTASVQPLYAGRMLSADVLNSKGMSELKAGNNYAAAEYFRKAITADPSKKNYYNNLAAAYMRMHDYYNAEQQLYLAISLDPGYTKALSNMSVVLFRTGRYREAYEYYLRAKKTDPAYTAERFEKKRVLAGIKEQSRMHPDDENLKRIILYMESGND